MMWTRRVVAEQGSGQPLAAHDLHPLLEGQTGGEDQAGALVDPAHDVEEQFCAGLREGHVAQSIRDRQVGSFQLLLQDRQLPVVAPLRQLGD
jgi:hypothetical protein